jgi:hypothetical protein
MPYAIEKHASGYAVVNRQTGKVHSKHTTEDKAKAQFRLLEAIDHDKNFVPNKDKKK